MARRHLEDFDECELIEYHQCETNEDWRAMIREVDHKCHSFLEFMNLRSTYIAQLNTAFPQYNQRFRGSWAVWGYLRDYLDGKMARQRCRAALAEDQPGPIRHQPRLSTPASALNSLTQSPSPSRASEKPLMEPTSPKKTNRTARFLESLKLGHTAIIFEHQDTTRDQLIQILRADANTLREYLIDMRGAKGAALSKVEIAIIISALRAQLRANE